MRLGRVKQIDSSSASPNDVTNHIEITASMYM